MSDDYVRVPASRMRALEQQERALHELRLELQQQRAAKDNAEFLQTQILPANESALELIAATTRKPPQMLDDLLPNAERDNAKDLISEMPEDALTKITAFTSGSKRTTAERNTKTEYMRPMQYGEIFATVLEMISHNSDVIVQTKLLTPQTVQTVMEAIETGMSRRSACALIGITSQTFARYKRLAEEEEPQEPFASFMQLLEMAEARAEAVLVGRWQEHTASSWQASKALLEKRFRTEWGDSQQIDLKVEQLMKMTPDELLEIMGPSAKAEIIDAERLDI